MADTGTRDLSVAAISVEPVDFDWSKGYGETWDTVLPDVDNWDLRKCSAFLEDQGYTGDGPEPNPFKFKGGRKLFNYAAELGVPGFDIFVDNGEDPDIYEAPEGCISEEETPAGDRIPVFHAENIREAIIEAIDSEEIDGIDDWRDACRNELEECRDRYEPMMNYYYPLPGLKYRGFTPEQAQDAVEGTPCIVVLVGDEPVLALAGGGMDLSPGICAAYLALGYYPPLHFASGISRLGRNYPHVTREVVEACVESARIAERWAAGTREGLEAFLAGFEKEDD